MHTHHNVLIVKQAQPGDYHISTTTLYSYFLAMVSHGYSCLCSGHSNHNTFYSAIGKNPLLQFNVTCCFTHLLQTRWLPGNYKRSLSEFYGFHLTLECPWPFIWLDASQETTYSAIDYQHKTLFYHYNRKHMNIIRYTARIIVSWFNPN